VVPYLNSTFGTSPSPANWGVVGWSMGGTCAVDLTVMHPELFSAFVDVAGDLAPVAGTKEQTIQRLFRGNAGAYDAFDPTTVIEKHGEYTGVFGWFAISSSPQTQYHKLNANNDAVGLGGRDAAGNPGDQNQAANSLCALGKAAGISCAVLATPGKHDWPFAMQTFESSLPWLAGQIGTPGVPQIPLPGSAPGPTGDPPPPMRAASR
jgi:S-formylglutathione hydrolase FrmB